VFRANVLNDNQRAVVEEAMTCMPVTKTKPLSKPKSRRSGSSSGGGGGGDGEGRGSGGEGRSGKPRK